MSKEKQDVTTQQHVPMQRVPRQQVTIQGVPEHHFIRHGFYYARGSGTALCYARDPTKTCDYLWVPRATVTASSRGAY